MYRNGSFISLFQPIVQKSPLEQVKINDVKDTFKSIF